MSERTSNGEATNYYVAGNGPGNSPGSGLVSAKTLVQPFNDALWPMLADKSQNFNSYSIRSLRFIYQAIKGSAYNGQITCGFTKDSTVGEEIYNNPDAIITLPCAMRFQASDSSNTLVVPASLMSQGGKSLFNPVNKDVAFDEPTRYFAGAFCYAAADCTDNTNIGRWHVEYDLTLEQAQLNPTPSPAEFAADVDEWGNGTLRIVHSGRFNPEITGPSTVTVSSVRPAVIYLESDEGGCTLQVNGSGATLLGTMSSGTGVLDIYSVPRLPVSTLTFSGVEHLITCVVSPGYAPAFVFDPEAVKRRTGFKPSRVRSKQEGPTSTTTNASPRGVTGGSGARN